MNNTEKIKDPFCYNPNNDPYPLCNGVSKRDGKTVMNCGDCCLYENMDNEGGYDHYDA